jgi:hypothetical protein
MLGMADQSLQSGAGTAWTRWLLNWGLGWGLSTSLSHKTIQRAVQVLKKKQCSDGPTPLRTGLTVDPQGMVQGGHTWLGQWGYRGMVSQEAVYSNPHGDSDLNSLD